MDKFKSFALAQWLSDYPDDMTYDEIIADILGDQTAVEFWEVVEHYAPETIVELIKGTEDSARHWFDEPKTISVTWSVLDVQSVRPDLSKEQAWEVLQLIKKDHSSSIGINWEVIESFADFMYPEVQA